MTKILNSAFHFISQMAQPKSYYNARFEHSRLITDRKYPNLVDLYDIDASLKNKIK